MSPDVARTEARIMAEKLQTEAHDAAHARIREAVRPKDAGNGGILMVAACVPLILAIVYVVSSLAGAISGMAAAGGAS